MTTISLKKNSAANSTNTRWQVDHPREFVFKKSLNAHLIKHRIRNQLACKYCSAHVSTIQELDNHVLEIHQIDKNTLGGKKVSLKGRVISDGISIWSHPQKYESNHCLSTFQASDFDHLFEDGTKLKIPSEITKPLK